MMRLTALEIIRRLQQSGYEAYVAGGYVRDMLLGRDLRHSDQDIATNANPAQVLELFADCRALLAGDSFPVVYVGQIEVATYRARVEFNTTDHGPRARVEHAASLDEDLARRDLTINAMAYDPFSGELVDRFGGEKDLEKGIIRLVEYPEARILEDPNRILRACRFLALLDGEFHPETKAALIKYGHLLGRINHTAGQPVVAVERISAEIKKAMRIPNASRFFRAMHEIGVLRQVLPGLEACYGHDHGEHHDEDVFEHSMLCGDAISCKFPLVKLAGYLHDVGKPASAVFDDGGKVANFIGHEKHSAAILKRELSALRFSQKEIGRICTLARDHMKELNKAKPKTIRKAVQAWQKAEVGPQDFIRICIADRRANLKYPSYRLGDIRRLFLEPLYDAMHDDPPLTVKDLAITGKELIQSLGMKPGPQVGWLQRALLDRVLEYPGDNQPERLMQLAKELMARQGR
jgi:tRNA nucleotidyltransferase (CCA-adding enzyme)